MSPASYQSLSSWNVVECRLQGILQSCALCRVEWNASVEEHLISFLFSFSLSWYTFLNNLHVKYFKKYWNTWHSVFKKHYTLCYLVKNFPVYKRHFGYLFQMAIDTWNGFIHDSMLHSTIPCFVESQDCFLDSADIVLEFPDEFPNSVDFNNKSCLVAVFWKDYMYFFFLP